MTRHTHTSPHHRPADQTGKHPINIPTSEWRFPINEEKKSKCLAVIYQEASLKQLRYYPTFPEHIWNQMRFQPLTHWLTLGILLLSAMLLALWFRRKNGGNMEMLTTCSVFFVFAGNICLSQIARLFSCHMAELEQTLYLNLRQMVCIRMLEAGIANLVILTAILGITGETKPFGIGTSLIYMLAPFLWSNILYLHMLTCLRNTGSGLFSSALGLLCGIAAIFPVLWESAYRPEYLIVWKCLTIAGGFLLAAEIVNLLGRIDCEDTAVILSR